MKIIFLDIDGVLNHQQYWIENPNRYSIPQSVSDDLDPKSIEILNNIVERTKASIVVSSTWRKIHSIEKISEMLKSKGYKYNNIIDKTPVLPSIRGKEIDEYLESKKGLVESYLIIDDEDDILLSQRNNFMRTSMKYGLTPDMEDLCVDILNRLH